MSRKFTTKMETSYVFRIFLLITLSQNFNPRQQRAKRLHGMFHNALQGEAHRSFIETLEMYDHNYDPEVHFGDTIPLLQSSGTGKSCMVDEIGNTVCSAFLPMHQNFIVMNAMLRYRQSASTSRG